MLNITEKLKESFESNDISQIAKASKYFARIITQNLMEGNHGDTEGLCLESSRLRDILELNLDLERDKNYYFGYIYAYENIARKLSEEEIKSSNIDFIVSEYPKVREVIMYLGKNQFATQGEIAKSLNISPSYLWNILNKDAVLEANIFIAKKVGRSSIYSLSERGNYYYSKACDEKTKMYNKEDIKKIISFISSNRPLIGMDEMLENIPLIDEELLELIYKSYIEHLDMCVDFEKIDDIYYLADDEVVDIPDYDLFESIGVDQYNEENNAFAA